MTPWWDNQTAGWIGGILGTGVGIAGGLFGTLAGILVPRGRGKRIVVGCAVALLIFGAACTVVGVTALLQGQPYAVWYMFLLTGCMTTILAVILFPIIVSGYRRAEQRRLDAQEFRRS